MHEAHVQRTLGQVLAKEISRCLLGHTAEASLNKVSLSKSLSLRQALFWSAVDRSVDNNTPQMTHARAGDMDRLGLMGDGDDRPFRRAGINRTRHDAALHQLSDPAGRRG